MPPRLVPSFRVVAAGVLTLACCVTGTIGDATPALANGPSSPVGALASPGGARSSVTGLRAIASRAVLHASHGELAAARRQVQALKRDWDAAEARLRSHVGSARWGRTSRSLDDALDTLQVKQPAQAAVGRALADLLLALYALESIE